MHWKTRFDSQDRAVSPVIGVILMVAVTVILAAVVSMLVLGLGSDVETHPQASFSFDYDDAGDTVVITHEGGDTLESANVNVSISGTQYDWSDADGKLSAGDSSDVQADSGIAITGGETVKVIWQGPNGDTAVLGTFEVP